MAVTMFRGSYSVRFGPFSLLLTITSFLVMISCRRVTLMEEKVVGIWESSGVDATGRIVFRRDHTVINLSPDGHILGVRWIATSKGKWHLDGNEIVTDEQMLVGDYSPRERRMGRIPIQRFDQKTLVRADGRPDFNRINVEPDLYEQLQALLYVVLSLIAFLGCLYAMQNPLLKKPFFALAIGAALALTWALSLLATELTQTGTVTLSWTSLRCLQWLRLIFMAALIPISTLGFIKLVLAGKAKQGD
jgi:hypothetical protein